MIKKSRLALFTIHFLSLYVIGLSGCGDFSPATSERSVTPSDETLASPKSTSKPYSVLNLPDASARPKEISPPAEMIGQVMRQTTVTCADSKSCPENLALVLVKSSTSAFQCSGFLVDGDVILTNQHCLPAELQRVGADCGDISFLFAATSGFKAERIACQQVLQVAPAVPASAGRGSALDFVVLKMAKPSRRKPFVLNRSGIEPNTTLTAYVVDPKDPETLDGEIRRKTCKSIAGTLLAPGYSNAYSEIISLTGPDCLIQLGNSGSALVDENGAIRGILYATVEAQTLNLEHTGAVQFAAMALADNISCLDLGLSDHAPVNDQCHTPQTRAQMIEMGFSRAAKNLLSQPLQSFRASAPKSFNFETEVQLVVGTKSQEQRFYSPQVSCFQSPFNKELLPITFADPLWSLQLKLNRHYQVLFHGGLAAQTELTLNAQATVDSASHTASSQILELNETRKLTTQVPFELEQIGQLLNLKACESTQH